MFLSTIIPLVFMALSTLSVTEELDKAINQTCFSLGWMRKEICWYFVQNRVDKQRFMCRGLFSFFCVGGESKSLRSWKQKVASPKS